MRTTTWFFSSTTNNKYRGKPCWIAREVRVVLDYAQEGQKLVTRISDEWKSEFELDDHYVILKGQELAEFKQLLKTGTDSVPVSSPQKGSHLMLIYEPGLYRVFTKTNKPVGVRLREFMATEILPPNSKLIEDRTVFEDRNELGACF